MQENAANPFVIVLLFLARCLVPLLIMLGISHLLRRLGWIKESPPQPPNTKPPASAPAQSEDEAGPNNDRAEGGLAHGKA